MDNESRASVGTTISHSSHATDVYPAHNHYDVPRDVISVGRAGDYPTVAHVTYETQGTKIGNQQISRQPTTTTTSSKPE